MLRIYLVRHGVTIWNSEGRLQGHTDVPLSEEGRTQAALIGTRLSDTPITAIWSSDMSRARDTAEAIAAGHNIQVRTTPLLRERMMGTWEGLTKEEIRATGGEPLLTAYRQDSVANRPPGAEEMQDVWNRLSSVAREIRETYADGTVVVVGHGGTLRVILCDALGANINNLRRLWLDNASLSLVECDGDKWWVRMVNDTCHLHASL